jgi:hypothetical protein
MRVDSSVLNKSDFIFLSENWWDKIDIQNNEKIMSLTEKKLLEKNIEGRENN